MLELTTPDDSGNVAGSGWGFPIVYDALIEERGGRKPHQFPGWDAWEEGDEAKACYARGLAEAEATQEDFWSGPLREDRPVSENVCPVSLWPIGPECANEDELVAKRRRPKRRTRR